MTDKLDKKDWLILDKVCKNARLSHNQIAKAVGLSKNAITYRIERLKKKGTISRFFTIINHKALGYSLYEVLLKVNADEEQEKGLIEWLKNQPNIMVLDRLSGEWDFVMEFGCKKIQKFNGFISELRNKFSEIINTFEIHPIFEAYKVEQMPIELIKDNIAVRDSPVDERLIEIDEIDKKLLFELNKDSTLPLYELSKRVGLTSETVSERMKKLKEKQIIIKFSAKISLNNLGYAPYLVILDLRNISKEKEASFRSYIKMNKQIRYAFMSSTMPKAFIYFTSKTIDELDMFIKDIKLNFPNMIIDINYMYSKYQYKYDLFPEGLLEN